MWTPHLCICILQLSNKVSNKLKIISQLKGSAACNVCTFEPNISLPLYLWGPT